MDWPVWLEKLTGFSLSQYKFRALESSMTLDGFPPGEFNQEKLWVSSSDFGHIPLDDYIYMRHTSSRKRLELKSQIGEVTWSFDPPLLVNDDNKIEVNCLAMTVKFFESKSDIDLDMKCKEYMGKPVAYGINDNNDIGRVALIASPSNSAPENEDVKFNLTISLDTT